MTGDDGTWTKAKRIDYARRLLQKNFLPHIGILNPTFDDDGVITKFDFILGSQG